MGEPGCLLGIGTGMGQRTDPAPPASSLLSPGNQEALLTGGGQWEEDHQGHQPQVRFSGLGAGFVILLCVPIAPWNSGRMGHRWEFSSIIHSGVLAVH